MSRHKHIPLYGKIRFVPNYKAFSLKSFAIGGFNRTADHDLRDVSILTENQRASTVRTGFI